MDYTTAFLHAPITDEVYVEMPQGFREPGKVLKLKRSLYGLKQSPHNFYKHLKGQLESVGFVQSNVDACLFISDKVILVVYVDDTLLFAPKPEYIDEIISKMDNAGIELEVEEQDVAGFLGISIKRSGNTIKLSQEGLIKRVVDTLRIGHLPRQYTPASAVPLVKDPDGDPPNAEYNYASVVGMMQYLQAHSRPEISYDVSQCARFTHCPRRSHEVALE